MAQMVSPGGSVLGMEKVPALVERSQQCLSTWCACRSAPLYGCLLPLLLLALPAREAGAASCPVCQGATKL
jgi:hypothetical protein